jgi:hypothetical protein
MKKLSEMTDEERYGKVGAEIRRLDPEAYKNRPKTMEGNLKLLKELRGRKTEEAKSAPRGPSRRYATGPGAKDKRAQEDFLSRNPQYRDREPGLQAVDEELFSPGAKLAGAGIAGGAAAYGAKKLLDRFRNKGMERAGKELAEKGVPSADELAKARALAKERRAVSKRERDLDERLASDMAGGYKRGGAVKSSASKRADGIAQRGKTRGKYI